MSEEVCCLSATCSSKAQFFFIHLLCDFYLLFSFIFSHPLYFSYFIFFSPYFLKIFSFLSPLFFTTSLLLLTFLANFISHDQNQNPILWDLEFSSKNNMGFLTTAFYAILDKLLSRSTKNDHITDDDDDDDENLCNFEDSEVFKIVFDIPPVIAIENEVEEEIFFQALDSEFSSASSSSTNEKEEEEEEDEGKDDDEECGSSGPFICSSLEKQPIRNGSKGEKVEGGKVQYDKTTKSVTTGKCDADAEELVESFLDEKKENILQSNNNHPQKVQQILPSLITKQCSSNSSCCSNCDDIIKNGEIMKKVESSRTLDYSLGTYGSMRKEQKEWKRTLACKLFEERHNVVKGGGEGMDLLWETYDQSESKTKTRTNIDKSKIKNKFINDQEIKEGVDDIDDDETNGQLCCLQAFKFSAGKMNLGMGKPNLVKITIAIKGFGWLHKVSSSSRRSKKVHNGD